MLATNAPMVVKASEKYPLKNDILDTSSRTKTEASMQKAMNKFVHGSSLISSIQNLDYSISDILNVLTIPLLEIGMAARLIVKSPFSTNFVSAAILLMSSIVSSVLTILS